MRLFTAVFVLLIMLVASPAGAADRPFPSVIRLEDGFRPEASQSEPARPSTPGRSVGRASIAAICGRARSTGTSSSRRSVHGHEVDDRGRLWVAGAGTGTGYVFDATTGAQLATFQFATTDRGFAPVHKRRDRHARRGLVHGLAEAGAHRVATARRQDRRCHHGRPHGQDRFVPASTT